ncbi:DUF2145 domain-containing protein [Salmonella enterica subsp. enterica]|nr:DUF2145 domain-containing protein [Salmonella enterica subsp. enterica]
MRPRSDISRRYYKRSYIALSKLNLFHCLRYNSDCAAFFRPYQNSNGWLRSICASKTMRRFGSRTMPAAGCSFRAVINPLSLVLALLQRLGAKPFTPNVFTDDQPAELPRGNVGAKQLLYCSVIRFIAHCRAIRVNIVKSGESVCLSSPGAKKIKTGRSMQIERS